MIQPFVAKHLGDKAILMVIFDIPEAESGKRRIFRALLNKLEFSQVQKSVWSTNMDYREILQEAITEIELDKYVQLFEAAELSKRA